MRDAFRLVSLVALFFLGIIDICSCVVCGTFQSGDYCSAALSTEPPYAKWTISEQLGSQAYWESLCLDRCSTQANNGCCLFARTDYPMNGFQSNGESCRFYVNDVSNSGGSISSSSTLCSNPTLAPTTKTPSKNPTQIPTQRPSSVPSLLSTSSPTSPPTFAITEEQQLEVQQQETKQKLEEAQESDLAALITLACVLLAITLLTILLSKFYWKDQNANYVTVCQNALSFFDFFSDGFFLFSLQQTMDKKPLLRPYFYVGVFCLTLTSLCNVAAAVWVVHSERLRKPDFRQWLQTHKATAVVSLCLAPVRANFLLIADSQLLQHKTQVFCAPLPHKLRTKFRISSFVQLILEDMVQGIIVVSITDRLLGGWTALNGISFCGTCLAMSLSFLVNVNALRKSWQTKKEKNAIELKNASERAVMGAI